MQFRTSHFFLIIAVIAIALTMRTVANNAKSDFVTSITALAISPFTTLIMQFLGANIKTSIGAGILSSLLVLVIVMADCLMHTPETEYMWRYISGDISLIIVPVYLVGSLLGSSVTAFLTRLAMGQH